MNIQKTRELVIMGVLTGIVFLGQVFMGFLPNVEIVTLLFILYTLVFGKKVFLMIYVFVFLEGIFYGFGLWWLNYLYVWSVQSVITWLCRKAEISFILECSFWILWDFFWRFCLPFPIFLSADLQGLLLTGCQELPMTFLIV